MLAKLHSVALSGIDGIICEVEVDVARGGFEKSIIVGLPDTAVKESTERVKSAVTNSGYKYPKTQSLINLAPADVKKVGPVFDLPIALGMLIGQGILASPDIKKFVILGELALDGRVREINGVLNSAITAAANGFNKMIVPLENAAEAAVIEATTTDGSRHATGQQQDRCNRPCPISPPCVHRRCPHLNGAGVGADIRRHKLSV